MVVSCGRQEGAMGMAGVWVGRLGVVFQLEAKRNCSAVAHSREFEARVCQFGGGVEESR